MFFATAYKAMKRALLNIKLQMRSFLILTWAFTRTHKQTHTYTYAHVSASLFTPSSCRSMSRGRSLSMAEPTETGLKDAKMRNKSLKMHDKGLKMHDKAQWKMNKMAKVKGERERED